MVRSNGHPDNLWQQRLSTLFAMVKLSGARLLVRYFPLRAYRRFLTPGQVHRSPGTCHDELRIAARRIERAAMRLPGETLCLPQAIALFWWARRRGVDAQLVIAIHRNDRETRHAYHAWIEHCGVMAIGACDRSVYQPLLTFHTLRGAATAAGRGR